MPASRRKPTTTSAPTHGHGHGHGHGTAGTASRRVRRVLVAILAPFAIATLSGVLLLYPFGSPQHSDAHLGPGGRPVDGVIVSAESSSCSIGGGPDTSGNAQSPGTRQGSGCVRLEVRMQSGPAAGSTIEQVVPTGPGTPEFAVRNEVVLAYSGAAPGRASSYQIVDFQRGGWMLALAGLFGAAVLLLGRWKGLLSLVALVLSFGVLVGFVFPAILAGRDPLAVAIVGSGLIMFTVLYLTHGLSAQTSTAVLGTLVSLSLIGGLSALFAALTHLTGLNEDTSTLINALGGGVDTRGLLLAGIVIGALGVLDDVTVTQTSAIWELRKASPGLSWRELYWAGLRIGRDHVSSAVNTLVLAYAGAALPLLLVYSLSGSGFAEIVTSQAVAQEVVRTLVGSVGLVAAVPVTTAIAAAVALRDSEDGATAPPPSPGYDTIADLVRQAAAEGAVTATPRLVHGRRKRSFRTQSPLPSGSRTRL